MGAHIVVGDPPERQHQPRLVATEHLRSLDDMWATPCLTDCLTTSRFDELSAGEQAAKRRKIERLAQDYIAGKQVYIHSSRANGMSLQHVSNQYARTAHSEKLAIQRAQSSKAFVGNPVKSCIRAGPVQQSSNKTAHQVGRLEHKKANKKDTSRHKNCSDLKPSTSHQRRAPSGFLRPHRVPQHVTSTAPASKRAPVTKSERGARLQVDTGHIDETDVAVMLDHDDASLQFLSSFGQGQPAYVDIPAAVLCDTHSNAQFGLTHLRDAPVPQPRSSVCPKDASRTMSETHLVQASSPFVFQKKTRKKPVKEDALKQAELQHTVNEEVDLAEQSEVRPNGHDARIPEPVHVEGQNSGIPDLTERRADNTQADMPSSPPVEIPSVPPLAIDCNANGSLAIRQELMQDTQALIDEAQRALFESQVSFQQAHDIPSMINDDAHDDERRQSSQGRTSISLPGPPSPDKPLPNTQALLDAWSPWSSTTQRAGTSDQKTPTRRSSARRTSTAKSRSLNKPGRSGLRFSIAKPASLSTELSEGEVDKVDKVTHEPSSSYQAAQTVSPGMLDMEASVDRTITGLV